MQGRSPLPGRSVHIAGTFEHLTTCMDPPKAKTGGKKTVSSRHIHPGVLIFNRNLISGWIHGDEINPISSEVNPSPPPGAGKDVLNGTKGNSAERLRRLRGDRRLSSTPSGREAIPVHPGIATLGRTSGELKGTAGAGGGREAAAGRRLTPWAGGTEEPWGQRAGWGTAPSEALRWVLVAKRMSWGAARAANT